MSEPLKQGHGAQIAFGRMEKFFENIQYFLDTLDCESDINNKEVGEKRIYLLNECKSLMQNLKTYLSSDDNSYLDMSGVGIRIKKTEENYVNLDIPASSEDKRLSKKLDNVYDNCMLSNNVTPQRQPSSISLSPVSSPSIDSGSTVHNCPYNGLPATHLKISKSMKYGTLIRMEKRFFLEQNKKIYAGLLDRWLLVYPGGLTDMKPTTSIYIESFEYEKNSGNAVGQNLLTIWNENKKRFIFQAVNAKDYLEWCEAILSVMDSNNTDETNSPRKLPAPPIELTQNETIENNRKSEEIYEEPILHTPPKENFETDNSTYDCIDFNSSQTSKDLKPKLPLKMKKTLNYNYDVPKPLNIIKVNEKIESEKKIPATANKKSWFLKRRIYNKKSVTQPVTIVPTIVQSSPEIQTMTISSVNSSAAASGSKVNMIINQLEANGKLNFLSKHNLNKNKRYTVYNEQQNLHNYEQINVKD